MKLDNIVVPTDFSETSINALKFAAGIARKFGSHIHLTHVYQRPYMQTSYNGGLSAMIDEDQHNNIKSEIVNQLRKIASADWLNDVKVTGKLVPDKSASDLSEDITPDKYDLIIMGTEGMTGLIHGGLFDTTTERVIRLSQVPVISVPAKVTECTVTKMLFATDFSYNGADIYKQLVDFAAALGASIEVVVINTQENYATNRQANEHYQELIAAAPDFKEVQLVIHNDESVLDGIRDLAEAHGANLIAMMTHGRRGFQHFLRGSIAEDISATVEVPLLSFKAQKAN